VIGARRHSPSNSPIFLHLVVSDMAAYWLNELATTIDDRQSPLERANFSGFLESFVRAIHQLARERNQPSTTTDDASQALALARTSSTRCRKEPCHQQQTKIRPTPTTAGRHAFPCLAPGKLCLTRSG
jgi:hypothetical protein